MVTATFVSWHSHHFDSEVKLRIATQRQYTFMNTGILAAFGIGGAELLIISVILMIVLLLSAIPAVLAFSVLTKVPPAHRKQTPALCFLLLIPIFSVVWSFFVHPKVAESLKSYFVSTEDNTVGDCGASLALWMCICAACSWVPILGPISAIASLVLAILFYVKAFDLAKRIIQ